VPIFYPSNADLSDCRATILTAGRLGLALTNTFCWVKGLIISRALVGFFRMRLILTPVIGIINSPEPRFLRCACINFVVVLNTDSTSDLRKPVSVAMALKISRRVCFSLATVGFFMTALAIVFTAVLVFFVIIFVRDMF